MSERAPLETHLLNHVLNCLVALVICTIIIRIIIDFFSNKNYNRFLRGVLSAHRYRTKLYKLKKM